MGVDQRVRLMQSIAGSPLPIERFMVGTGAASLQDAVQLTRTAFDLNFAAALVLPPFFFRDVTDDGIVRYFDELLRRAHAPGKRVLLYNFPRMSGVTFHADLVDRLVAEFPEADRRNEGQLERSLAATRGRETPTAPHHLPRDRTIAHRSQSVRRGRLHLRQRRALAERRRQAFAGDEEAAARAGQLRAALAGPMLIPVMRYLTAKERNDVSWERMLPPLTALNI